MSQHEKLFSLCTVSGQGAADLLQQDSALGVTHCRHENTTIICPFQS